MRLCIVTLSESSMYNCDQMSILNHGWDLCTFDWSYYCSLTQVKSSPGYTANEPVALICNLPCANVSGPLCQPNLIAEWGPKSFETQYCEWYHTSSRLPTILTCSPSVLPSLYKNSARVKSKQPSHPNDFYLSCISVDHVSQPHTAKSIIRCISKQRASSLYGITAVY
jgi:hypothetical protein